MVAAVESLVTCVYCATDRPAVEVYEPVPRSGTYRCRDTVACQRTTLYANTGMEPPSFAPPAAVSTTGSVVCDYCRTGRPAAEVYQPIPNGAMHRCRDTAACAERSVGSLYLTAQRDDYPEVATTTSGGMRHATRAAGAPPVPAGGPLHPSAERAAEHDAAMHLAALARR